MSSFYAGHHGGRGPNNPASVTLSHRLEISRRFQELTLADKQRRAQRFSEKKLNKTSIPAAQAHSQHIEREEDESEGSIGIPGIQYKTEPAIVTNQVDKDAFLAQFLAETGASFSNLTEDLINDIVGTDISASRESLSSPSTNIRAPYVSIDHYSKVPSSSQTLALDLAERKPAPTNFISEISTGIGSTSSRSQLDSTYSNLLNQGLKGNGSIMQSSCRDDDFSESDDSLSDGLVRRTPLSRYRSRANPCSLDLSKSSQEEKDKALATFMATSGASFSDLSLDLINDIVNAKTNPSQNSGAIALSDDVRSDSSIEDIRLLESSVGLGNTSAIVSRPTGASTSFQHVPEIQRESPRGEQEELVTWFLNENQDLAYQYAVCTQDIPCVCLDSDVSASIPIVYCTHMDSPAQAEANQVIQKPTYNEQEAIHGAETQPHSQVRSFQRQHAANAAHGRAMLDNSARGLGEATSSINRALPGTRLTGSMREVPRDCFLWQNDSEHPNSTSTIPLAIPSEIHNPSTNRSHISLNSSLSMRCLSSSQPTGERNAGAQCGYSYSVPGAMDLTLDAPAPCDNGHSAQTVKKTRKKSGLFGIGRRRRMEGNS